MISTRMTMVRNHVAPQVVSSTNSVIVDNNIIVSPYSTERFSAYLLDQHGDPMPSMPTGDWRWGYTYAAPYPHGSTTWTTYNPTYDPATGLYSADADISSLAVNYYELIVELQRFIPSYDSNMQIVASMPIEH